MSRALHFYRVSFILSTTLSPELILDTEQCKSIRILVREVLQTGAQITGNDPL